MVFKKLKTLEKIAQNFKRENISWAVGASLMLYFHDITDDFNDIDIMIDEKDVEKTIAVMDQMAKRCENENDEKYKTRYFLQYEIDEVEIDIMAGFVIVKDSKDYDCSFDNSQISRHIRLGLEDIPLHDINLWRRYYFLMGRENKVEMIDRFLNQEND